MGFFDYSPAQDTRDFNIKNQELKSEQQQRTFKSANEPGIAGFILSLILPIQHFVLLPVYAETIETLNYNYRLTIIGAIIALVLSIIGTLKNGKFFQKGLTLWGLVFNILFTFDVLLEFIKINS